jgi:cell division protein FtsB
VGKKLSFHQITLEQIIAGSALAISVVFLVAFGGQIVEIYRLRSALSVADTRLANLRAEQAALEATRAYVQSDPYAEKVAREELNKIRPGDQRTIVIPRPAPGPTPTTEPVAQGPAMPSYLGAWWELLFGE